MVRRENDAVSKGRQERLSVSPLLAMKYGVAETSHLPLNSVRNPEAEWRAVLEVGLDRFLAGGHDDQDIPDSTSDELFDDVLQHRLSAEGEHLLWDRAGKRAKPGAVTSGRNQGARDLRHQTNFARCSRARSKPSDSASQVL